MRVAIGILTLTMAAMLAAPASSEVRSATEVGFEVASTAEIAAPPAEVYGLIGTP